MTNLNPFVKPFAITSAITFICFLGWSAIMHRPYHMMFIALVAAVTLLGATGWLLLYLVVLWARAYVEWDSRKAGNVLDGSGVPAWSFAAWVGRRDWWEGNKPEKPTGWRAIVAWLNGIEFPELVP